tara:strand:+ start:358 stop:582 length:225 start_codon:yes stop_codon:yes gene_type:complete
MELNTEKKMEDFIEKYKYVVIFPDKKPKLFKSLREIENEICISASSISKKLKQSKNCICQSKGTEFYFFIQLLN